MSDYELAFSCAVAALALMRIVHLRLRWLKIRKQLRAIENPWDEQSVKTILDMARRPRDPAKEKEDLFYDRFVVLVLVLAVIWSVGRIFTGA